MRNEQERGEEMPVTEVADDNFNVAVDLIWKRLGQEPPEPIASTAAVLPQSNKATVQ